MYHSVGMHRPPLPAELGPSFSVADALAAGATPSRLRALDLVRPFHGVRQRKVVDAHDASPEAALLRLIAQYACRMTEHEFFSHTAAAVREPLHRRDPPALTSLESLTSALDAGETPLHGATPGPPAPRHHADGEHGHTGIHPSLAST